MEKKPVKQEVAQRWWEDLKMFTKVAKVMRTLLNFCPIRGHGTKYHCALVKLK